jgi:chromosome segregation ATPase
LGLAWVTFNLRLSVSSLRAELHDVEQQRNHLSQVALEAEASSRRAARDLGECQKRERQAVSESRSFEGEARQYHHEAVSQKQMREHAEEVRAAAMKTQREEQQQECDRRVKHIAQQLEKCTVDNEKLTEVGTSTTPSRVTLTLHALHLSMQCSYQRYGSIPSYARSRCLGGYRTSRRV